MLIMTPLSTELFPPQKVSESLIKPSSSASLFFLSVLMCPSMLMQCSVRSNAAIQVVCSYVDVDET